MSFSLQVDIADVVKWHADPLHNAVCAGHVIEAAITNMSSVPVGADGSLHVFDGGVHHKTHELMMEYSLPFVEKGRNYTLYGKYLSEGAAREWSTVVDISMTTPSFKPVSLSLSRSPLSKTPK